MTDDDRPRRWRTSRYDGPARRDAAEWDYADHPAPARPDPRRSVQGPGWAMSIVGWAGLALTILILVFAAIAGAMDATLPRREYYIRFTLFGAFGSLAAVMFAVVGLGGDFMRRCRHYKFAMTAAICLIASIAVFGLLGVVTVPFGVWALVVLTREPVKREFERVRRGGGDPLEADYEDRR